MKRKVKKVAINSQVRRLKIFALVFVVIGLALLRLSFAQANTVSLYMTVDDEVLDQNQVSTLSLRVNTAGQNVDGVEAYLSYNTSHLEFVAIEPAGSAFSVELGPQSGGGGSVTVVRGSFSPVNGDVLMANVKFKALVTGTDTQVNYQNNSNVTGGGTYLNPSKSGVIYTLGAPEPEPEPEPEPQPQPQPTGGGGSGNTSNSGSSTSNSGSSTGASNTSGSTNQTDTSTVPTTDTQSVDTTTQVPNNTEVNTPLPDAIDRLPTTGFIARNRTWFIGGSVAVALAGAGLYGVALVMHKRNLSKPITSSLFTSAAKPASDTSPGGSTPPTKPQNEIFYPDVKSGSKPLDDADKGNQ